ncbi:MAG: GNAT family N-acetyltransferase [Halobacteriales archaeon]
MDVVVLGTADEGPSLRLDHEAFAYAGKFVMTNTGKALAREGGSVVGAAAFNRDRTDETTVWVRYITVRTERRGEGIGPTLLDRLAKRMLAGAGGPGAFSRVRIAVNNPFAFEAAYKAGFSYVGEQTGLAELVLERPGSQNGDAYRRGIELFADRSDLTRAERRFVASRREGDPPGEN